MDNRAGEMEVFLRVVEAGSFSGAARLLRMTPSNVSKLVARIEERLGVRLVERSTRKLSLTGEGRIFYDRSQAVLADLDDVEREIMQGATSAEGTVRVNASVAFGTLLLEPLLPDFWKMYPDVVVDLSLSDEVIDLYLDRTDVAFRVGNLPDSALVARRLGVARRKIVASPAYLSARGMPLRPEDLAHHDCLGFNFRRSIPAWPMQENGRRIESDVKGPLLANNGETVRRLALLGAGLARLGDYHVRDDLRAGRLVEVLTGVGVADEEEVHAVSLGARRIPRRVRAFLDHMVPRLAAAMVDT